MRYFITNYQNQTAKDDLHSLGLFCYSLRSADDDWSEIATIEEYVLVNRYGSIITNEAIHFQKQYPDNFIDFKEFELENQRVSSICDLKDGLKKGETIDLSSKENIDQKFNQLFDVECNPDEYEKKDTTDKLMDIIQYYSHDKNYHLLNKGGNVYQLYHLEKIEMELSK